MKEKRLSMKKIIAMMIMAVMVFQCIGGGGTILAAEDGNTDYQMNEAITNVSIQAKVDGGWYEIPQVFSDSMPAIERDAEIRVAISYEPSKLSTDFKAGDTISYQLPSGIKATEGQSGDVYDGRTVVGRYEISTAGVIKITLTNEKYIEESDGKLREGTISFEGHFDGNKWQNGGKQEVALGNAKFQIKFEEPPKVVKGDLYVDKSEVETVIDKNDPAKSYIKYKIVVTAPKDNTQTMPNVKVTDTFSAGAEYINGLTVESKTAGTFANSVWTIGDMPKDTKHTLVIKANLKPEVVAAASAVGSRTITNKAVVKSNNTTKDDDSVTSTFNSGLNITKTNGGYVFNRDTGKAQIKYTVKVSAPANNTWSIENVKVVDTFTKNGSYVTAYYDRNPSQGTTSVDTSKKVLTWNIGTIHPGEEKILTYYVDVNQTIFVKDENSVSANGDNKTATNTIQRDLVNKAQIHLNNTTTNLYDESTVTFKKVWLRKNGKLQSDGRVKFTVKGNEGNPMLNGTLKFTDTLTKTGWAYDHNSDLVCVKYSIDANGNKTKKETITIDLKEGQTSWEQVVEGGYYYEFTYFAKYTGTQVGKPSVGNKAGITVGIGSNSYDHYASWSGTGKDYNGLKKGFESSRVTEDGTRIVEWKSEITTNIQAGAVYTDYRDSEHAWTFTDEQIQQVTVTHNGRTLVAGENGDYTIARGKDSSGKALADRFVITFTADQSGVTAENPIRISYKTTLKTDDVAPGSTVKYVNKSSLKSHDGRTDYSNAEYTYLAEQRMTKDVGEYNKDTGELTWLIKVNNTGSLKGTAVVVDELKPGLKYVKAEISENGSNAKNTKLITPDPKDVVDGRIIMHLTDLQQTNDKTAYVVIKVTTKVIDKEFLTGNGEKKFSNTATLTYNGTMTTDSSEITVQNKALEKTGIYNENTAPNVVYTIQINPNGLDMLHDEEKIFVTDTMGENMSLNSDTLEVKDKDGNPVDYTGLSITGNTFSFYVPDDKALTITYKAYVSGEPGTMTDITNTVTYSGMVGEPGVKHENKVRIAESRATIKGAVGFYLVKKDSHDIKKPLEGTEFTLYKVGTEESTVVAADKKGEIAFTGLDETAVYAFKETKAADGYLIDEINSTLTYVAFNKEAIENANLPNGTKVKIIQSGASEDRFNELNTTTNITFKGTKTLENANYEMEANAYKFELTGPNLKDKDGKAATSVVIGHDAAGNIAFPVINYELKELEGKDSKTYTYTIKEKAGNAGGVTYSTDVYTVVVTVTKDVQTGEISAAVTDVKKNGGEYKGNGFDFVNTYDADDVTDVISGTKKAEGMALESGDYTFQMVETTDGVEDPYRATAVNDASGAFSFNLPVYTLEDHGKTFTYEISEVNGGQKGMTYDEAVYTVTVTVTDNLKGKMELDIVTELDGETAEFITFTNKFKGSAELTKTNGKDGDALELLPNAEFELYRVTANGDILAGKFTTGEGGKLSADNLVEGSYYFVETKAPAGHKIVTDKDGNAKKYRFEIGLKGNSAVVNAKITASNEQKMGTIGLVKKDAETAALIEGAEFSLYKDGVEYQPGLRTDEEGKITVSSLPWGEYWFVETAPAPGYIHDAAETQHVTIDADYVDGDVVVVDKTNKQTEVFVTKTDITGEKEVAGATMEIYRVVDLEAPLEGDNLVPVTSWTSGEEAHLIKGLLAVNETYVLKETIAPAGYGFIKTDIVFSVNADGSITSETAEIAVDEAGNQILLVKDDIIDLKISKTSFATGKKLAGAVLAVYNKETGEEVVKWTSTEEGCYDFGAYLTANETYILKELEAPAGYVKIDDVEFTVENEGQIIILTDSKFVTYVEGHMEVANCPEVPKTGDDFSSGNMLLAMLLAMGGMAVAAIPRRKRQ